jgi:putative transposase
MNALPLQFLMLIFAGWVSRHQQDVIDYLQEENLALREQMGAKRLRFTVSVLIIRPSVEI